MDSKKNSKNSKKLEKNFDELDCISRADAIKAIQKYGVGCLDTDDFSPEQCERFVINKLNELPSVTPQEPFKPMVEIDLDYVIKQTYIERDVLDKIRAEIDGALSDGMIHKATVLGIIDKYKSESEEQE